MWLTHRTKDREVGGSNPGALEFLSSMWGLGKPQWTPMEMFFKNFLLKLTVSTFIMPIFSAPTRKMVWWGSAPNPKKFSLKIIPSVMDIICAKFELYISNTDEVQSFHEIAPSAPQGVGPPKFLRRFTIADFGVEFDVDS